jgi:L-amino acid N-acyltransferase YncA
VTSGAPPSKLGIASTLARGGRSPPAEIGAGVVAHAAKAHVIRPKHSARAGPIFDNPAIPEPILIQAGWHPVNGTGGRMRYYTLQALDLARQTAPPKRVAVKNPPLIVRPCFQQDLQTVQLIYAHHVLTGTGSFETDPPSLEEITSRWSNVVDRGWPYMVASPREDMSRVLAFAYAVQYRDRAAYAKTFEVSVYAGPTTMRRGAGSAALAEVLTSLRSDGAHQALAFIGDSGNAASIGLHLKLGFQHAGTLSAVGEKFGKELDVIVMQRTLRFAKSEENSSKS